MLRSLPLRMFGLMCLAIAVVIGATWAYLDASHAVRTAGVLEGAAVLAVLFAAALAVLLGRWVSSPLGSMAASADRIASGDLSVRTRARRDDEIGALGRALDRMADQLEDRFSRVRDQEARLRAMLDAMVEAVLVADREGRVVLSNAAFGKLADGDPIGRRVIETVRSPELHDAVERAIVGMGGRVQVEINTTRTPRTLRATISPLPEGKGAIAVMHDVTELERANAIRRDFVANASHELRTPLTSIRGFAETLQSGALDDPKMAKRFVSNIVENSVRLSRLVDDLLELSRSESPNVQYELEPVSIAEVATKVLRALEAQALDKKVELALETPAGAVWARAELRALEHVIVNLVDNGIKYTPSGGKVIVRASKTSEDAILEVEDNGQGIGAEHLPRIFERFYRVDPGRARQQGGTGLGLAIVKHLVLKMDGEITVASRMGKGTTFKVELPIVAIRDDDADDDDDELGARVV
jgi:two-component system phosphate regulon sensor histidine kinase PhoR